MQTAQFVEALQADLRELSQLGGEELVQPADGLLGSADGGQAGDAGDHHLGSPGQQQRREAGQPLGEVADVLAGQIVAQHRFAGAHRGRAHPAPAGPLHRHVEGGHAPVLLEVAVGGGPVVAEVERQVPG